MNTFTLPQFAGFIATLASQMPAAKHHALELSGQIVEDEAKSLIGTYDYNPRWPELAEATKEDRVAKGFSENEPGLRTGEMRDSINHVVHGDTVYVGSDENKLLWFELGTSKQPPRTVLKGAVLNKIKEIEHITGLTVKAHISARSFPNWHHEVIK